MSMYGKDTNSDINYVLSMELEVWDTPNKAQISLPLAALPDVLMRIAMNS